jgi:hypothetical protein
MSTVREANDKPVLMGRYIGPQTKMTKITNKGVIKVSAQPSTGEAYPVIGTMADGYMILLHVSKNTDKWVLCTAVQQFWLLPDGTELEALE